VAVTGKDEVPESADGARALDELLRDLAAMDNLLLASRRFESTVLALLRAGGSAPGSPSTGGVARAEVQTQSSSARMRFQFDAVVEGRVGDLPGPVAVDIRYFSRPGKRLLVRRLRERLRDLVLEGAFIGAGAVLVVQNAPVDDDLRAALESEKQTFNAALRDAPQIAVWGVEELRRLADEHPAALLQADWPTPLQVATTSLPPSSPQPDYTASRERSLADLQAVYASEGISLFIGAGASVEFGLPSWSEIIADLYGSALEEELGSSLTPQELAHLQRLSVRLNSDSPLQAARAVQRALTQRGKGFEERLSSVLYRDVGVDRGRPLLWAISDLCMATRRGSRVHSVVTYNFDDLLEENLTSRRVRALPVFEASAAPSADELPVYHVHGFLPRDRASDARLEREPVVFAEQQYHALYTDPYHWTNIVQLNAIRERTCVFIGLSMTDPNLRRLLEIGSRSSERVRHYAFLKRRTRPDLLREDASLGEVPEATVGSFLAWHHGLAEEVLRDLGVQIVWFDDYGQIRDAIQVLADL
jgi:hypothetical protein